LALIELVARGITVSISPFGATIVSLRASRRSDDDGDDERDDVVLGFDDCESYDEVEERPYFGAVCGRVANRIANGEFAVGRKTHCTAGRRAGIVNDGRWRTEREVV
jgi:aldose 1-epimerase